MEFFFLISRFSLSGSFKRIACLYSVTPLPLSQTLFEPLLGYKIYICRFVFSASLSHTPGDRFYFFFMLAYLVPTYLLVRFLPWLLGK